jgi:hypothetical protein
MSLCQDDCEYKGYDSTIKKSKCECSAQMKTSENNNNKNDLLNNLIDLNEMTNFKVMKCFKKLFNIEGLRYNIIR